MLWQALEAPLHGDLLRGSSSSVCDRRAGGVAPPDGSRSRSGMLDERARRDEAKFDANGDRLSKSSSASSPGRQTVASR